MRWLFWRVLIVSLTLLSLLARADPLEPVTALIAEQLISPAKAAAVARAAIGGRVLAVRRMGQGPSERYRVRLLVHGQVRVVQVNALNGRLMH